MLTSDIPMGIYPSALNSWLSNLSFTFSNAAFSTESRNTLYLGQNVGESIKCHWKVAADLLGTLLKPQQHAAVLLDRKRIGVAASFKAFAGNLTKLFGSVSSTTGIAK